MWVWSLCQEDPLEEDMATHSCIPVWSIPCTEEPGRIQSVGSHRVGHSWSDLACPHPHSHTLHIIFASFTLAKFPYKFQDLCCQFLEILYVNNNASWEQSDSIWFFSNLHFFYFFFWPYPFGQNFQIRKLMIMDIKHCSQWENDSIFC